jgi:flagellar motor switch protein FliM/N
MSTTAPPQPSPERTADPVESREEALAPSPQPLESELLIPPHTRIARLPVEVDVAIPLRDFRVRHLLALRPGAVVESQWGHGDDVPLGSRDVQLAWSEFEVADTHLAVRLTRLI